MVERVTSENATSSSLVLPSRQTLRARSGYSGPYRVGRPRWLMPPFFAVLAGGNNQAPEPGVWLFDHQYSGVWHPDGHNRNDASKRCSRKMAGLPGCCHGLPLSRPGAATRARSLWSHALHFGLFIRTKVNPESWGEISTAAPGRGIARRVAPLSISNALGDRLLGLRGCAPRRACRTFTA
jgi:hypothetical protein